METSVADRVLFCFAEGTGARWEAFCVDFDLAVQGTSFEEVRDKLDQQIKLYVDTVDTLPEADRRRLLRRRAPMRVTLGLALRVIWTALSRRSAGLRHDDTMRIGHGSAAA